MRRELPARRQLSRSLPSLAGKSYLHNKLSAIPLAQAWQTVAVVVEEEKMVKTEMVLQAETPMGVLTGEMAGTGLGSALTVSWNRKTNHSSTGRKTTCTIVRVAPWTKTV